MTTPSSDDAQRRAFWIEQMENSFELMSSMHPYPVQDNLEGLVSIREAMVAAGAEVWYSESKIVDDLERIFFIRESLAPDLVAIAQDMNAQGWILKIEDGFRTREMQTKLGRKPAVFDAIVRSCIWECNGDDPPVDLLFRRAMCLVANIPANGTHLCGAAVDISVFDRDSGAEVCRGKPYLEMSALTPMSSPFVSNEARANRRQITELMERHGFMHYPGEFWHYNKGDALYQILTKSGKPGHYAPVDWDPATNTVTPFADILAPLTVPEQLEAELLAAKARLAS